MPRQARDVALLSARSCTDDEASSSGNPAEERDTSPTRDLSPTTSERDNVTSVGGGFVDMQSAYSMPMEAFEISDSLMNQAMSGRSMFAFTRSARRSIMLQLGMAPVAGGRASSRPPMDLFDPYSKASDDACATTYLAAVVGIGTFSLSSAVATCGWLPGLIALLTFSFLHSFFVQRLVEVPHLIGKNLENIADCVKACFNDATYRVFLLLSVTCWWGVCCIFQHQVVSNIGTLIKVEKFSGEARFVLSLVLGIALTPFAFKTSAKELRKVSKYSLVAISVIAVLETLCALSHLCFSWGTKVYTPVADVHSIGDGIYKMLFAFGGIGMMPYIVAEMVNPAHARQMALKACGVMTGIYVAMGMGCYYGWGDQIRDKPPLMIINQLGGPFSVVAHIINIATLVKVFSTWPLFFWPFCREVEAILALDDTPEVELQLPWATRLRQHQKTATRLGLVFLVVLPQFLDEEKFGQFTRFILAVPLNAVHYLFPALLAMRAIIMHKQKVTRVHPTGPSCSTNNPAYFLRNLRSHYWATAACTVAMFCLSISILWITLTP